MLEAENRQAVMVGLSILTLRRYCCQSRRTGCAGNSTRETVQ